MKTRNGKNNVTKRFFNFLYTAAYIYVIFSFFIAGCGDNTIDNSGNGCSKLPNLIFPPDDTLIYSPTVDFRWFEPSCGPEHYKLIIYGISFYDTILTTGTAVSRTLPVNFSYHWRVVAFYGNPVNDSAASATYDFFLSAIK